MRLFVVKTWSDYGFFYLVADINFESAVRILQTEFVTLRMASFEAVSSFESLEPNPRFIGRTSMFRGIIV